MPTHFSRPWLSKKSIALSHKIATETAQNIPQDIAPRIEALAARSRHIHERDCFNLNPATNTMNPRAEALLSARLGTRPSLGAPGDKYEMGLEAIEEIEVIAAELACAVFNANFAEIRVGSGALANLYCFMALCQPGDAIIVPPGSIGGHVTHHSAGAAGLYGVEIHEAPVASDGYTVDTAALAQQAHEVRPKLITIGGSLNLTPHPVAQIRKIADDVGASILFDAAHQCGIIAGGQWPNPLHEGADVMTMSTYKSLGGPPSGLIVTNDVNLAQRLDTIAFPGLTANFDVAKTAALAVCLADWQALGAGYATTMISLAKRLATELLDRDVPVYCPSDGTPTQSHQFAIAAHRYGGGQAISHHLRRAGFLTCGIGLPLAPIQGDLNGLRIGTPELVRWGMNADHAPRLADLLARALSSRNPEDLSPEVSDWRQQFSHLHYILQ
jgi:glycine hydroxymethyltransferase